MDCYGSLSWTDIEPGMTLTGEFQIKNIGEPLSELDWEINEYPSEWGSWTFNPESGENLHPEDGDFTIDVTLIAPEDLNSPFNGEIIIINTNNPNDYCTIGVSISKQKSIDDDTPIALVFQLIAKLRNHKDIQELVADNDAEVDIQQEISSIIERDEELNSVIEQLSVDDCGCDDESLPLEWEFPILCILLIPLWAYGMIAWFMGGVTWIGQLAYDIGGALNCFWA